ncbi:OmpP1/FadL family transporter [Magnetococcus sp. PR-3]|uniref:OmpP1/FadL family transporter n=1 Tax=Magnetococcus sp. PR-3 TaxID=3120355 RepID=UPI002FCE5E49
MLFPRLFFASILLAASTTASAGGLDLSGQSVTFMHKTGSFASYAEKYIEPHITGRDLLTGDSIEDVHQLQVARSMVLKAQLNPKWSVGLVYDNPYGANVKYQTDGTYKGVTARVKSRAVTALVGYEPIENLKLTAGIKHQVLKGNIALPYINSFTMRIPETEGLGYVVGASYAVPKYAFRASIDYHTKVEYDFTRYESGGALACATNTTSTTKSIFPDAFNFRVQSGVMDNTMLFAYARLAQNDRMKIRAACLNEASLTSFKDSKNFSVGAAHRWTEDFSSTLAYSWQGRTQPSVSSSPLTPTNGKKTASLNLRYVYKNLELSGSLSRVYLGDDVAGSGAVYVATFKNNTAWIGGLKVKVNF